MRNPVNECTRTPNCTKPVNVTCDRFQTSRLNASEGTSFVVDVGPSGGARGYSAITGTLQEEMSSFITMEKSYINRCNFTIASTVLHNQQDVE